MKKGLGLLLISLLFSACINRKQKQETIIVQTQTGQPKVFTTTEMTQERDEPIRINAYQPARTLIYDLLHTRLEVRPVWEKAQLEGKAWLTMRPWFYAKDSLILDAKAFNIKKVALVDKSGMRDLPYTYDDLLLRIKLDKTYSREETFEVYIEYTAKPEEVKTRVSPAFAEDKGLYFINPKNDIPGKPQQIWTQGETQGNSAWFPTFDTPNERCTQELAITVDQKFTTLSNGLLLKSENNSDGTRTDYWKQNVPHAPYLFAMAIGEFAVLKDKWRDIEVNYYVEPEYEPYARTTFGITPEMIEFYSTKLGVDYPWEKYSQVVVRDFVSGAMENTTAVIHYGGLQQDDREYLDHSREDIIAHELSHHWFGDLVTCESWPNLPLNESFATFCEVLWQEYKHGPWARDRDLAGKRNAYFAESRMKKEPLIRFKVVHRDDMFDAHSYQKGSQVLHMLRKLVGDEAFFEALKTYLNDNAFKAVEIHHLRLAFEKVTGRDLNWFFNQWFLASGHPELNVRYDYAEGKVTVKISQTQKDAAVPVYRLPVSIAMEVNGNIQRKEVLILSRDTSFSFQVDAEPAWVDFDPDKDLLAKIEEENKSTMAWVAQLRTGTNYFQKKNALDALMYQAGNADARKATLEATKHEYWGIRYAALTTLGMFNGQDKEAVQARAIELARDQKSVVRSTAISQLEILNVGSGDSPADPKVLEALKGAINDKSYSVQSKALRAYTKLDREAGLKACYAMEQEAKKRLIITLAKIYMEAALPRAMDFITEKYGEIEQSFEKFSLLTAIGKYLPGQEADTQDKGIKLLMKAAENEGSWWVRLAAARGLAPFKAEAVVKEFFLKRKTEEENPNLKSFYEDELSEE